MPLIIDTSVLIDYLRLHKPALQYLDALEQSREQFSVSIITAMEVIQGSLSKKTLAIAQKFLTHFPIIHISRPISKKAFELQSKYHLPHNLSLPDSFIAATTLEDKSVLVTRNVKDFHYIHQLKIVKPY